MTSSGCDNEAGTLEGAESRALHVLPARVEAWGGAVIWISGVGGHTVHLATIQFNNPAGIAAGRVQVNLRMV